MKGSDQNDIGKYFNVSNFQLRINSFMVRVGDMGVFKRIKAPYGKWKEN